MFHIIQAMSLQWFYVVSEVRDTSPSEISGLIELGLLQSGWE